MTQGNSSDEETLTKGGRTDSSHGDANSTKASGIRVQTDVEMKWDQNDRKARGVSAYVNSPL